MLPARRFCKQAAGAWDRFSWWKISRGRARRSGSRSRRCAPWRYWKSERTWHASYTIVWDRAWLQRACKPAQPGFYWRRESGRAGSKPGANGECGHGCRGGMCANTCSAQGQPFRPSVPFSSMHCGDMCGNSASNTAFRLSYMFPRRLRRTVSHPQPRYSSCASSRKPSPTSVNMPVRKQPGSFSPIPEHR